MSAATLFQIVTLSSFGSAHFAAHILCPIAQIIENATVNGRLPTACKSVGDDTDCGISRALSMGRMVYNQRHRSRTEYATWCECFITSEIALTLFIVFITAVLFISEWLRADVVALLVLGSLAVTGLVTPTEALSGFSNPTVVTVWAMFIISDGGRQRPWRPGEVRGGAGGNPTADRHYADGGGTVRLYEQCRGAALMLPVVMSIASRRLPVY